MFISGKEDGKKSEMKVKFDVHPMRIASSVFIGNTMAKLVSSLLKVDKLGFGAKLGTQVLGWGATMVANNVIDKIWVKSLDKEVTIYLVVYDDSGNVVGLEEA